MDNVDSNWVWWYRKYNFMFYQEKIWENNVKFILKRKVRMFILLGLKMEHESFNDRFLHTLIFFSDVLHTEIK